MHHKKRNIYKIFTLLFTIISVALVSYFAIIHYSNQQIKKHIFSHRGASGEEIEHTFRSYDLALLYGSKYIEQDLVTSKDNTLFISHDSSAKKIAGINKLFSKMSDKEIHQLRTKDNQPILSLQEVFDKYQNSTNYVIELKENSNQTELFEEIIKKNKLEEQVIVQASDPKVLDSLENIFPTMPKLLLVKSQFELEQGVSSSNVDIISVDKKLLNQKNVDLVHSEKKQFNAWTLNETKEIKKAISLNIDSYFTDYTAKALVIEKEKIPFLFNFF